MSPTLLEAVVAIIVIVVAWQIGLALAPDVFRHRILLTYEAEAKEVTAEEITRQILDHVPVP